MSELGAAFVEAFVPWAPVLVASLAGLVIMRVKLARARWRKELEQLPPSSPPPPPPTVWESLRPRRATHTNDVARAVQREARRRRNASVWKWRR